MNDSVIILQLIFGGAGGYIAGARFDSLRLGPFADVMAGVVGGGLGGQVFQSCCGCDFTSTGIEIFLTSCVGGFGGGALLAILAGLLKWSFCRRP